MFYRILIFQKLILFFASKHGRDMYGLLENSSDFTKNEIIQAKKELLSMNIKDQDKYVLLINRGNKYLNIKF